MNNIWILTEEFCEEETEVWADTDKAALLALFNQKKEDDRQTIIEDYGEFKTIDEAEEGDIVIEENEYSYTSYELGDYHSTYYSLTLQEVEPYSSTPQAIRNGHVIQGGI